MTSKADIEAGVLKYRAQDKVRRGSMLYARYTQLQAGMRRLAAGESSVEIPYQSEYTYRRLRSTFSFSSITMRNHRITVSL